MGFGNFMKRTVGKAGGMYNKAKGVGKTLGKSTVGKAGANFLEGQARARGYGDKIDQAKSMYGQGKSMYDQGKSKYDQGKQMFDQGRSRMAHIQDTARSNGYGAAFQQAKKDAMDFKGQLGSDPAMLKHIKSKHAQRGINMARQGYGRVRGRLGM